MPVLKNLILIALILPLINLNACLSLDGSSNTLIKQSANRQHTKKIILFLRESGATVSDSYQVSIADYNASFDTASIGNVFIVDGNSGEANLDKKCINFNWLSENSVEIDYDKNLRAFSQRSLVNKVSVTYRKR